MPNIRALYQFVPMHSACPEAGSGAVCASVFLSVATVADGGATGLDCVGNVGGGLAVAAGFVNVSANQLLRGLLARRPFSEFAKDVRAKLRRALGSVRLWLVPLCPVFALAAQMKTGQSHFANWPVKLGTGCGGRI